MQTDAQVTVDFLYFPKRILNWQILPVSVDLYITAWKVSKYGVISGPYFLVLGLNTDQK